ncbi:hypothetical protein C7B65_06035 [Phormidesmis priestleyi ULC007]|uniref:Uncharacterized protein n=1 Tax=Phormidesmis priestleyi ULC007 TaxID=1920490 RepID=A0A2T1DKI1_9CYAN|nr:hypothetical protein [Phormidesmis priestleyi]PSB20961.1 hypothetical protein C7B65_06035 [Phormidesmis priestleyi ULC007]PZO51916.1 MAG: hypothetical protein DCF14_08180 [Phormidesmis priestleyi]
MMLTTEELLAGGSLLHEVEIPADLLNLNSSSNQVVKLRPLTVRDLQLIGKAARDDESLSAALMIQQALVEPALKMEQISKLSGGLARFLVQKINAISGINTPQDALEELVQAPLARACFTLAKEFGWTPEEVSGMTIGQILLYLEMARRHGDTP